MSTRRVEVAEAHGAFQGLRKAWANRGIGRRTKIHLFKTYVRPVLLYGGESWKITKNDKWKPVPETDSAD